jgi:hypothetical protein
MNISVNTLHEGDDDDNDDNNNNNNNNKRKQPYWASHTYFGKY